MSSSGSVYAQSHPGLIPNDILLFLTLSALLAFVLLEICFKRGLKRRNNFSSRIHTIGGPTSTCYNNFELSDGPIPASRKHVPIPNPVFHGMPINSSHILDVASLSRYIPRRLHVYDLMEKSNEQDTSSMSDETKENSPEDVIIGLPNVPGCEMSSSSVIRLAKDFPNVNKADLVRFLVARKGNVEAAAEMFRKASAW